MADWADDAAQTEELFRQADLTRKKRSGPAATGNCLNCEDEVKDGHRWCCSDCRDDWEYRQSREGGA
jgi:hypothetical protein